MSPNVGNFVHDLVEMAKAMETLPLVERQLSTANDMIDNYAKQVQDREMAIISYKDEIEQLHAKVRSLEVERDDASFRVLEAEDKAHDILGHARTAQARLWDMIELLDPPKPEPLPEPQAQPVAAQAEGQATLPSAQDTFHSVSEAVHSISETGQSKSPPTVSSEDTQSPIASSTVEQLVSASQETSSAVDPGPALGPYFGKRYHDHPTYLPLHIWLDGGGTEEDYHWRPSVGFGSI